MKKLLNTLYITSELSYLSLDGENIIISNSNQDDFRLPLCNIQEIVCFNYKGCSPRLMGKCAESNISLVFISPSGRFLARIVGKIKGNVFTRIAQINCFNNSTQQLVLIRNTLAAKFANTKFLLSRSLRDYQDINCDGKIEKLIIKISDTIINIYQIEDIDILRGIEGEIAKEYFSVYGRLIRNDEFVFYNRSKHPPLDEINAVLSLLYTLQASSITSALEAAGIDPYIGYYHTLRSGRASLSLDIVEEFRSTVERFVISIFNRNQVNKNDFEIKANSAVLLNDEGRHKVIKLWQEKKKEVMTQSFINQKIQFGLLPFVQAQLLGKYLRKEIEDYPPYVNK